ncbi:MAG TPA: type II secretion system protein [Phycisphaerales bacterium]|nr:type II secretion system protein [Phycisphaerales bacterium]
MRTQVKRAFTLIEILIVVVILGILAAIVIPQFSDASTQANEANVRSQLQTLRGQLELYKVQHQDIYPDLLGNGWADLVAGDYIQAAPRNPLQDPATATAVGAAAGANVGWVWTLGVNSLGNPTGDLTATDGAGGTFVE